MAESKYNLADEKWIYVMPKGGGAKKISLKEAFLHAGDYIDLSGETRLQDISILRVLIAISVTLLYRYDENGNSADLRDSLHALERFRAVWGAGGFPEKAVNDYFEKWHDRFFLFDSRYPFYQISLESPGVIVTEDTNGKGYNGRNITFETGIYMNWMPMANVNGRILQSNNKVSPFKDVTGKDEAEVSYDEAARWLIYYDTFADCVAGKRQAYTAVDLRQKKETPNAGMTMPSKGMLLTPVGNNLFETIMLGSVLFDSRRELYGSCIPAWEKENRDWNKKNVAVPYDLPQMYTQQARRMYIVDEDGHVPGIYVSAGEVYSENLLFMNPAFAVNREEKKDPTPPVPIRCPDSPDIWKAIAFIAGPESSGVREWVGVLAGDDIIEEDRVIPFRATGIRYGASCCSVEKIIEDNIVMNRAFIRETERQIEAVNAIKDIEKISDCVYMFGKNCSQCMGFDKKYKKIAEDLKKQYSNAAGKKVLQFAAGKTTADDLQKAKSELARKITNAFVEENIEALLKGQHKNENKDRRIGLGDALRIFDAGLRKSS